MSWDSILALLTLTGLEIALGVDNIIFISLLLVGLSEEKARRYRLIGISLAVIARLILLFFIVELISLDQYALFSLFGHAFSVKDLVLLAGGGFLLYKATWEIHHHTTRQKEEKKERVIKTGFWLILQIVWVDVVFSVDSILTAVALTQEIYIMAIAIVIAMLIIAIFSGPLGRFIERNPSLLMLALAFIWTVGLLLVLEAFGTHVPREYVYVALAFSTAVEFLNIRAGHRKRLKEKRKTNDCENL
ncbi:MAG: TerC family protein [Chlorobi bacterium]|nr:TerC family protein [Chlorobiota bacterium]